MKQVYLAHPLSAPTSTGIVHNKEQAQLWLQWACDNYRGTHCFSMMWLLECANVYTPEQEEESRPAGMKRCLGNIKRCDELWLTGVKVSSGMADEGEYARRCGYRVYDLTTETLDPRTAPRFPPEDMVQWKAGSLSQQVLGL
jgi:hypothetical protein